MHTVIGEVTKATLENLNKSTKDFNTKGGFDLPGEISDVRGGELGKGELGKPGSSFDGPWDQKELHEKSEYKNISDNSKNSDKNEGQSEISQSPSINGHLEGKKHPDTGVRYERMESERPDGTKTEIIAPQFDSVYNTTIDKNESGSYTGSRQQHENMANKKLKEDVNNDKSLADKFTKSQLEQINNGDTPDGYTWHHDAEPGRLQLVDSKTHADTRHTGGYSIWGKPENLEA